MGGSYELLGKGSLRVLGSHLILSATPPKTLNEMARAGGVDGSQPLSGREKRTILAVAML